MSLIYRALKQEITKKITSTNKIIILYGPRQVGKTTLAKEIIQTLPFKSLSINADEQKYIDTLSSQDLRQLQSIVIGYDLLFIDEAQRIPNIGINLKILTDSLPHLKIIATGSSSFELANKINEPLTGRTWTYTLYPISYYELSKQNNPFELKDQLQERLVYGSYPEVITLQGHTIRQQYLNQLTTSYIYKDILELTRVENPTKLPKLLQLIAFQIGSEVSYTELGVQLEMSKDTVMRYIDLLEKAFVIFRLKGLSRNLRKEVNKMDKIYFYDLGIRNSLIRNFNLLTDRDDIGKLWENFLMVERKKYLAYTLQFPNTYFWRTHTGAELDYIEEQNNYFNAYEFKYTKKNLPVIPTWSSTYSHSTLHLINRDNFLDLIAPTHA